MPEKAPLRETTVHALAVLAIFASYGLALDPAQPAGSYIRTAFTVELRIPARIAYQTYAGRTFRLFRKKTGTAS